MKISYKNLFPPSLLVDYKVFIFQIGIGILDVYPIGCQSLRILNCLQIITS